MKLIGYIYPRKICDILLIDSVIKLSKVMELTLIAEMLMAPTLKQYVKVGAFLNSDESSCQYLSVGEVVKIILERGNSNELFT